MNYQSEAAQCPAALESPIQAAKGRVQNTANRLSDAIEELTKRIDPILKAVPESDMKLASISEPTCCELEAWLSNQTYENMRKATKVEELIKRLAL